MNVLLRTLSPLALAAALALSTTAHAATASAPAAAATPPVAIDAEKQKQIDRILAILHPENGVLQAVQEQAARAMQQSNVALQNAQVPQERGEKALKDIQTDVQKYIDTTMPVAVASAKKFTTPTSAPILAAAFTTDELRQLATMLESPLRERLDKVLPQMQNAVGQKVSADIGPTVSKNAHTMGEAITGKLRAAVTPATPATPASSK
ncbi:MAG: hypothetical protein H7276_05060 [Caulobacter sp.]|nr:hypothetical protein [Vitreoscilla sp.]